MLVKLIPLVDRLNLLRITGCVGLHDHAILRLIVWLLRLIDTCIGINERKIIIIQICFLIFTR